MDSAERRRFDAATLPHLDAAYNLARWLTRDEHAAEDVVQDAFLRAAKYFEAFRGGDGRPWLLGIVRRASFDWLAARKASPASFDNARHDIGDDAANPERLAIRSGEQASVRQAVEELPLELREAIVLREFEGLSYQEIAAVAGIPVGTVMSRLSRGRQRLRERLGQGEPA